MRKTLGNIEKDNGKKKWITTPVHAIEFLATLDVAPRERGRLIASIKVLSETINAMENKDKEAHWLFGKLFLYMFDRNLVELKNGNAAMRSILSALKMPMEFYYDQINMSVHHFNSFPEINKLTEDGKIGKATEKLMTLNNDSRDMINEKINLMLNDNDLYL